MKQKRVRTPGNRNVAHRKPKKTSAPTCSACGSVLHGIRRLGSAKLTGSAKSQKRVSRKFGGAMCTSCSREAIRTKARII